jgi:hypothetical protein
MPDMQWTYNLILCGVAFPAIGLTLNRLVKQLDKQGEQITTLATDAEKRSQALRDLLEKKADKDDIKEFCERNDREHEDIWKRVNRHKHNGDGRVVLVE